VSLSPLELEGFVARMVCSPELWEHLVQHDDSSRVFHQIWDDEDVNAWLICWSEDQDTGYHDHNDSVAAIEVISGHVREDRLRLSDAPHTRVIGPGERFTLPATAIHRVLHAGSGPAVTIHAYSPPLRSAGAYTIASDGTLERTAQPYQTELAAVS
jgi:mannose-6-phosphate isomerase-like protein (cupin superfamily)